MSGLSAATHVGLSVTEAVTRVGSTSLPRYQNRHDITGNFRSEYRIATTLEDTGEHIIKWPLLSHHTNGVTVPKSPDFMGILPDF